ncbi:MAG: hypothetical protein ACOYI3_05375 [Christensenellales bacterium]|jgi:predicted transcriptional regulator
MKLSRIIELLDAKILGGQADGDLEIASAFGSDMMSDVLAFDVENTLLLTGLVNQHVIRTAELLDVKCVLFVRGKTVPKEVIQQAEDAGICLLHTSKTLYVSCGILYNAGLPGCQRR